MKTRLYYVNHFINSHIYKFFFLMIVAINIFSLINYQGHYKNLLQATTITLNEYHYILMLFMIIVLNAFYINNYFHKRYSITLRYIEKRKYFRDVAIIIAITTSILLIINLIIQLLFNNFYFLGDFYIINTPQYEINYLIYYIFKYIVIFIGYNLFAQMLYLVINKTSIKWGFAFAFLLILQFAMPIGLDLYNTFTIMGVNIRSVLSFEIYHSFLNEVFHFGIYIALLVLIIILLRKLLFDYEKNFRKYIWYRSFNDMKRRDLFLLGLYILFLIFYIPFSKDFPPEMRLATGKLNEIPFLCLIYKTYSIALVVYLVASQLMYDLKYIASSIFTRINKKHWLKEKRIVLLLLVIVIRSNFLLLTNDIFNIIFDMIYYIMIVYSVIYLIWDKHPIKYIYAIIWAVAVILVENNVVFLIINLVLILLTGILPKVNKKRDIII